MLYQDGGINQPITKGEKMYKETIEALCNRNCKGNYCVLKEIISHSGIGERQVMQFDMLEMFKFELSDYLHGDCGTQIAGYKWVEDGLAKTFAEVYGRNPHLKPEPLYKKIMEANPPRWYKGYKERKEMRKQNGN